MLFCLLCLHKNDKLIKISSKKAKELNCSAIIAQHFWLKPNTKNNSKESVCVHCWSIIQTFHELYLTVAAAHNYKETKLTVEQKECQQKCKLDDAFFFPEVKVELTDLELLPQTEVIESSGIGNEESHSKLRCFKQALQKVDDTSHQPISDKQINQESNHISDIDSDSDIPLSRLSSCHSKLRQNEVLLSAYEDSYESTTSSSDSDATFKADDQPLEYKSESIKRKTCNLKQQVKESIKLDGNISKYFKELKCAKCEALFQNFNALMQHAQTAHSSTAALECCARVFRSRKRLSKHALTHLFPQSELTCLKCDSIFKNELLLAKHIESNHRCVQCSKEFLTKRNLKEHRIVKHPPKSEFKVECAECHKTFPIKRRLLDHMKFVHGTGSPIICEICGKWLKHRDSLRAHKKNIHEPKSQQQCSICNKTLSCLRSLERHVVHSHQKHRKFKCPMCEKGFNYNRDLQQHINLHTKAVTYKCDICEKTFNQTSSLHKHKSNYHPNKQLEGPHPLQCQICSAWLKTLQGLKQHIRVLHDGSAGDHQCHVCNHVSVNAIALKRHIKRNHGNKVSGKSLLLDFKQHKVSEPSEL